MRQSKTGSLVSRGTVASDEKLYGSPLNRRLPVNPLEISSRFSCRKVNLDVSTKRLATAILTQALRDVLSGSELGTQQVAGGWRKDALKWFASDEEYPGSLLWVSGIIEADVEDIRQWIVDHASGTETDRMKWRRRLGKRRSAR